MPVWLWSSGRWDLGMCYNTPLGLKSPLKQSHNYVGLLGLGFGSGSLVTSDPDAMKMICWMQIVNCWEISLFLDSGDSMEVAMHGIDSSIDRLIKIRTNRLKHLENITSFCVWMD